MVLIFTPFVLIQILSSSFSNSIKSHKSVFEVMGLIVKEGIRHCGLFEGELNRGEGAKSRTSGRPYRVILCSLQASITFEKL